MIVFVDESGDAGMKLGSGSSSHFLVALVIFDAPEEAERCDQCIKELRATLQFHAQHEFHFSKLDHQKKLSFLRAVSPFNFKIVAFALNKAKVKENTFQYPEPLYKCVLRMAFENAQSYISNAKVVIDGCSSREFKKQLKSYLASRMRKSDGSNEIKKIAIEQSHTNNLLQLADMIAGALSRQFKSQRESESEYRTLIASKVVSFKIWPK